MTSRSSGNVRPSTNHEENVMTPYKFGYARVSTLQQDEALQPEH